MKKKKHILRNTIIIICSVIAVLLGTIGVLVYDNTDNTPDYITEVEGEDVGTFMSNKATAALENCGPLDDFEFLFTEREINDLLATIVPIISIPMVNIKSIYVDIADDDSNAITAEAPLTAAFYTSCAKADGYLSYDKTCIKLNLNNIKVNLLDSRFGIVDWVLSESRIKEIQQAINDAGVSLTIAKEGKNIVGTMTNLDIIKTIINCTKSGTGFLVAALTAGALSASNIDIIVNTEGLTGIILHRSLL